MRSSFTLALGWAALAAATVNSQVEFKLPLDNTKTINCTNYAGVDVHPDWADFDLTGIPVMRLNYNTEGDDIYEQDPYNSEVEGFREGDQTKCKNRGDWALTFEEGPSRHTRKVLRDLKNHDDIKATFFVLGHNLCDPEHASVMIDAVNAGHEIGIMGWTHPRLSALPVYEIFAEIKWAETAVLELTGMKPKFFRPPYGNMDDRVRFILNKLGYIPVLWTADTEDWKYNEANPEIFNQIYESFRGISRNIKNYASDERNAEKPGTISVQHDMEEVPSSAVASVISVVNRVGWTNFVPMTTCLNEASFAQNGIISAGKSHGQMTEIEGTVDEATIAQTATPEVHA